MPVVVRVTLVAQLLATQEAETGNCKFKLSVDYRMSSRVAWATQRNLVLYIKRAGAQFGGSAYLACTRLWVQSPTLEKKKHNSKRKRKRAEVKLSG